VNISSVSLNALKTSQIAAMGMLHGELHNTVIQTTTLRVCHCHFFEAEEKREKREFTDVV
jgi:hypothetical protein